MINERMLGLGKQPNPIRVQYAYGLKRKAEIGEENVFDLSIGNPSIPALPRCCTATPWRQGSRAPVRPWPTTCASGSAFPPRLRRYT